MRIILSRKGFDSGSGGVPNPILPDGRLVPLPIPDQGSRCATRRASGTGVSLGTQLPAPTRGRVESAGPSTTPLLGRPTRSGGGAVRPDTPGVGSLLRRGATRSWQ